MDASLRWHDGFHEPACHSACPAPARPLTRALSSREHGRGDGGRTSGRHHHGQHLRLGDDAPCRRDRSEEHTSELQSLMRISYAVFCLKKKKNLRQNECITNMSI